jgi:hypothetical protein
LAIVGLRADNDNWLGTGVRFSFHGGYLNGRHNLLQLQLRSPQGRFEYDLLAQRESKRNRAFFGLGPHSSDRRGRADRRRHLAEGSVAWRPAVAWRLALTMYIRDTELWARGDDELLSDLYPDDFAVARKGSYHGAETALEFGEHEVNDYLACGLSARLVAGYNRARTAGHADYRHHEAQLRALLNLYRRTRVLVLQIQAEGVDAVGGGDVPYTELPRLGGKTGLRGYHRYRFAGSHALLLTAEYRYAVSPVLLGRLFVDWGSVADSWGKLRLADISPTIGGGLAYQQRGVFFGAHVGFSREGAQAYIGTTTPFGHGSRRLR